MIKKDIIEEKKKALADLQLKSTKALDLVTATINDLLGVNEKIDSTISEINDVKSQLQDTEDSLQKTKDHNEKVIEKFRNLIEV